MALTVLIKTPEELTKVADFCQLAGIGFEIPSSKPVDVVLSSYHGPQMQDNWVEIDAFLTTLVKGRRFDSHALIGMFDLGRWEDKFIAAAYAKNEKLCELTRDDFEYVLSRIESLRKPSEKDVHNVTWFREMLEASPTWYVG